jgi:ADP-ribose pyrophosphatase
MTKKPRGMLMGKFLELCVTDCGWEYVRRVNTRGAVIVLVYHKDKDRYLMVEQFRPPVGCRVLEHPAGLIDDGETDRQAAVRELMEETGVCVSEDCLIDLGLIFAGVGMTDEQVHLFAVVIDNSDVIKKPQIQGAEISHGLKTVWADESMLITTKAAKALCVYVRFKAKMSDPLLVFPD